MPGDDAGHLFDDDKAFTNAYRRKPNLYIGPIISVLPLRRVLALIRPVEKRRFKGYTEVRALERHYKATELVELWGMSVKLVRKIFAAEPGVLKVDRPELRNKRGYCSLRIPESVAISVHKRMSV